MFNSKAECLHLVLLLFVSGQLAAAGDTTLSGLQVNSVDSPTGYLCSSSDADTPTGWATKTCDGGAAPATMAGYAVTCTANAACKGFNIDTGSSDTPCYFATAAYKPLPVGDFSKRYLLCQANTDPGVQTFSSGALSGANLYTMDVTYVTAQLTVTVTVNDPSSSITVGNGAAQVATASGTASAMQHLNSDAALTTHIYIIVTATDAQTETYEIQVTRIAAPTLTSLFINATFNATFLATAGSDWYNSGSGLMSPGFSATTYEYNLPLTYNQDEVTFAARSSVIQQLYQDDETTGTTLTEGVTSPAQSIAVGFESRSLSLKRDETASTGTTTETRLNTITYRFMFTRSPPPTLSSLTTSTGTLSPTFDSLTTSYQITVSNGVTSITVVPTVSVGTSTVTVSGAVVTSGSSSLNQALNETETHVPIVVAAGTDASTFTYTITMRRRPALSAFTVTSGATNIALSPAFDPTIREYTVSIANSIASVTVSAAYTPLNGVTLQQGIYGQTMSNMASGTQIAIPLAEGGTKIYEFLLTSAAATVNYTVAFTRAPSSSAGLADLIPSSSLLSPSVNPITFSYTSDQANVISQLRLTPSLTHPSATATIDGQPVAQNVASQPINLIEGGDVTVLIVVTAQDTVTNNTYTLVVSRAPSVISTLSSMILSSTTLVPVFDSASGGPYTAYVINSVAEINITATSTHPQATMAIEGSAVTSGTQSPMIALLEGGTTSISVVVTAQDTVTTTTYSGTVTRQPSSVSTLSNLTLSFGTLTPAFSSGTVSYQASVPFSTASIELSPTVTHLVTVGRDATSQAGATVTVGRDVTSQSGAVAPAAVPSGSLSNDIALTEGRVNTFRVLITAQNTVGTTEYRVDVMRGPSSDSELTSLIPSEGTLSPAFSRTHGSYAITVFNNVSALSFSHQTNHFGASFRVDSAAVSLIEGSTVVFNVTCIAQDGFSATNYTIHAYREKSTNSDIRLLTPIVSHTDGILMPNFLKSQTQYSVVVPNHVLSISFYLILDHFAATVSVHGADTANGTVSPPIVLTQGVTLQVDILVKAQKGNTKLYHVDVTRSAPLNETCSFIRFGRGGASTTPLGLYAAKFDPQPYYNGKQWYRRFGSEHFMYWDMVSYGHLGGRWVVAKAQAINPLLPDEAGNPTVFYVNHAITSTPDEIDADASPWQYHFENGVNASSEVLLQPTPDDVLFRIFCSTEGLSEQDL